MTIGCCAFSRASRISLSSSFFTSNSVCLSQSCAFIPDISTSSSPSPAHVTPRVTLATRQTFTTHLSSILSRKPLFYEPSPCPSVRLGSPSHYNRDRRNRPYNYCDQPLHHSATILVAKLLLPHLRLESKDRNRKSAVPTSLLTAQELSRHYHRPKYHKMLSPSFATYNSIHGPIYQIAQQA